MKYTVETRTTTKRTYEIESGHYCDAWDFDCWDLEPLSIEEFDEEVIHVQEAS